MELKKIPTLFLGIPLFVISCGTAPQSMTTGIAPAPPAKIQEVIHPQAYYHFLQGYLAEINSDGITALKEYQLGLNFDPNSAFLMFRIAKIQFSAGHMDEALGMARKVSTSQLAHGSSLLDLAKIFMGAGEAQSALHVLDEGGQRFPEDESLMLAKGNLLLNLKEYTQARQVFEGWLQAHPRSAESSYYLGLIAQETKKPREAAAYYQQAIAANTAFERAYLKLIALWEDENEPQQAIALLETYLKEVNPHNREFRLRLVRLYVLEHQSEKGLAHLDHLLDERPDDLHAHVRKAQIYGDMKNFPAAIQELNDVLEARPNELRVRDFLGLLYEEMKDYDRAIATYQANLAIDPTFFDSVLHLGFVSYRLKRNNEAISYLEKAIKLNPKRTESYLLFGLTYFQMEDYQSAKTKLEEGILQDPANAELHFNLGTVLDKLNQFDEAVREMQQTLELDPEHADALNYLGYSYADRGIKFEEALDLTRRAVALKPHNGYYVDSLAWALYKLGRVDEALEAIQRAASLVSDDPVIYEHLGEIFLSREERDKARDAWLHSLQLDSTNESLKKRFREMGFGEPIPTISHQSSTLVP